MYMKDKLPFYQVAGYPAQVTGTSVLTRLLDSLGFRFHWATQGLAEGDYAFSPGQACQSIGQLIGHIWGLTNWVSIAVLGQEEKRPAGPEQQRAHTLQILHRLREHFSELDDRTLAAITVDDHPFWHLINGPLADALTHVGQINVLRRLAGNPTPEAGLFTCEPPGARKPESKR
jgi:hypothetical protein